MIQDVKTRLSALAPEYDALLCDVWGVMHNGVELYDGVLDAFAHFKAQGGHIVLITNAPRPSGPVIKAIEALGASSEAYDDIVTSGDATIELIRRQSGNKVHHIGPEKDLPLFDNLNIEFTGLEQADVIVCTDLYVEHGQNTNIYAQLLAPALEKNTPMICANPDLFIDHGGRKIYCAGMVAEAYEKMGGEVVMVGKPHGAIYDIAMEKLQKVSGKTIEAGKILAIGDSIKTDLAGAHAKGLSMMFIQGGIHALEDENAHQSDAFLAAIKPYQSVIKGLAPRLVW